MTPMDMYEELKGSIVKDKIPVVNSDDIVIHIQMGICSKSVGAIEVLESIEQIVREMNLKSIKIKETGCGGFCAYEPIISIEKVGNKPITYCFVTPEKVRPIITEYILRDNVIREWTLEGKDVLL